MATLTEKQKEFVDNPFFGVVTALRPDGSPHSTVVWVDRDDGTVAFNTAYPRAKPRYLERDSRVGLLVLDPNDPYRWLSVTGKAELTVEGADEHIDRLAKKYIGKDRYPSHTPEEQRVTVRIHADRIEARGIED
jgi:PPOX class probable F420-dependent enzyme